MPSNPRIPRLVIATVALAVATGSALSASSPLEAKEGRVCIAMTKMFPPQCVKWKPTPMPKKPERKPAKPEQKKDTRDTKPRSAA